MEPSPGSTPTKTSSLAAASNDQKLHEVKQKQGKSAPTSSNRPKKNPSKAKKGQAGLIAADSELTSIATIKNSVKDQNDSPKSNQKAAIEVEDSQRLLPIKDNDTSEEKNNDSSAQIAPTENTSRVPNVAEIEGDDDGDPIPSGTGVVNRDCSLSELSGWSEILTRWHSKLSQRPKGLDLLVRNGIPEPLRGEVWQLLSGAHELSDLMDRYRMLVSEPAPSEQIILRDVHRTYPAHENFKSGATSNSLVDSLFKVCKAYAVYDAEVGYCQGLSFLVAALLLHMPEEQAFCVFVRIMHNYGLRNLFRNHFEELYLKFYQLERLLEENMPDLYQHFARLGIEPFTYASQWFLTVFTAKFPLNAVFYIMDMFLLDGMNTIFQIALALLQLSRRELLLLDFEGVLKYFRVQMPKRYRDKENLNQLIGASLEFNLRKLSKHAKSYELMKQKEKLMESPLIRLQRENAKLTENNLRLEQENDDLARDLVASKVQLRAQLDVLEDRLEALRQALAASQEQCKSYLATMSDMEDDRARLEIEVSQLKEVCRRELRRAESEISRDSTIISDYKKICSQLSKRLEYKVKLVNEFLQDFQLELKDDQETNQKFHIRGQQLMNELNSEQLDTEVSDGHKKKPNSDMDSGSKLEESTESNGSSSARMSNNAQPVGAYVNSDLLNGPANREDKIGSLMRHIEQLELELAGCKLSLVEAECKCQQLTHDLSLGATVTPAQTTTSGLVNRIDQMKAAVSARSASVAFARINNLISEKISMIGPQVVIGQSGDSPPAISKHNTSPTRITRNISNNNNNNNISTTTSNSNANIDNCTSQC